MDVRSADDIRREISLLRAQLDDALSSYEYAPEGAIDMLSSRIAELEIELEDLEMQSLPA